MEVELFDYRLPEELIAQRPAPERDASRLLVCAAGDRPFAHRRFSDLPDHLRAGDVLVFNDSRVIRARLIGEREGTGGRVELFLLQRHASGDPAREQERCDVWQTLAKPAKRLRAGDRVLFGGLAATVMRKSPDGSLIVRFAPPPGEDFDAALERLGHIPLPPYIRRADDAEDARRYQTVYASAPGSAAAPTAGLHFTPDLLDRLRAQGVETVFVTLHVGLGTFRPVKTERVEDHAMHTEHYHIGEDAARRINLARQENRRIICVGTTAVRALESASRRDHAGNRRVPAGWGSTDIFIYPGHNDRFFMVKGLITNFHLPKSTLLMLVSAFMGREETLRAYREAVRERYRFFSYGDAMLLLPDREYGD
ncbi:MAG: tRNA preQ1(34) S-adenosylmethionine ribosyltransferase-isomerase QueA [Candidatus Accumulibacter sp.]|jgi:S-adenosylmethionine:tRNA ribosyltransferase-isomerase|nr:tRNA preQ1(34) S-adenosylmethionine ribosyltransferase-isomerase QueA [Accumulibacter sp.]